MQYIPGEPSAVIHIQPESTHTFFVCYTNVCIFLAYQTLPKHSYIKQFKSSTIKKDYLYGECLVPNNLYHEIYFL